MRQISVRLFGGYMLAIACLTGCNVLQVPIEVSLDERTAAFDVTAGTPEQNTFSSPIDTAGITLGSGSVRIDPAAMSVMATDGSGAKLAQVGVICADACDAAAVDATTCDQVCNLGEINVTLWIGGADEISTVCETGDVYGPYRVTLDGTLQPVSVTPSSVAHRPS